MKINQFSQSGNKGVPMEVVTTVKDKLQDFFTPRRIRDWREYLTGYLMISPAVFLIFLFGIFPVAFALYVSLQKWKNV